MRCWTSGSETDGRFAEDKTAKTTKGRTFRPASLRVAQGMNLGGCSNRMERVPPESPICNSEVRPPGERLSFRDGAGNAAMRPARDRDASGASPGGRSPCAFGDELHHHHFSHVRAVLERRHSTSLERRPATTLRRLREGRRARALEREPTEGPPTTLRSSARGDETRALERGPTEGAGKPVVDGGRPKGIDETPPSPNLLLGGVPENRGGSGAEPPSRECPCSTYQALWAIQGQRGAKRLLVLVEGTKFDGE